MRVFHLIFYFLKNIFFKYLHPNLQKALSVESHMTFDEKFILYKLSRDASVIAEIGSYIGASACCFGATASTIKNSQIIAIDTWNNDAMSEGYRDTWSEFQLNTSSFSDFVVPVRGFSAEVVEKVRELAPSLDLLFIDGDHSYQGVKTDWEAYKDFLKPGSIVVFHDYGWAEGVKRVVHEDVLPLVSSHNQLPNMWWGCLSEKP
jgi:predicted O-methyltransferase YrrM